MDQAKAAISNIIGRGGAHDTTVNETVNAPVTSETVKPTRHEELTTAVDKEVHKDHYHTTVQPLSHRQVLPEQHNHQVAPVQEREFHHGDSTGIKQSVQAELGQFRDSSQTASTTHTASQGSTVAGEHTHHHVHEQVQPVIHKETIQPSVVHTVVPVHETHQAPSEHHGLSTLPVRSLNDFEESGVPLTGSSSRHETYQGDPRQYNPQLQVERHDVDKNFKAHDGLHSETHTGGSSHEHGATSHTGSGVGAGVGAAAATASAAAATHHHHEHHDHSVPKATAATVGQESSIRRAGETPAHNTTTGSTTDGVSTLGASSTHTGSHHHHTQHGNDGAHPGREHTDGHGITNQQHHGTTLDNTTRDDTVQHGTQSRDPAVVDDKSEKKLTGTGADGSHSAVFGLTPDGHKHDDTSHTTTPLRPAHGGTTASRAPGQSDGAGGETVADQINDPRVAEKGHGGAAVSATGSGKPGAGLPSQAGSQGLGEVRPQDHGAESKLKNKLDPTSDADGDGKRGVMD